MRSVLPASRGSAHGRAWRASALVSVLLLAGCRVGGNGKSFLNENDELRRSNLELTKQVEASEEQIAQLEGELEAYRSREMGAKPIEGAVPTVLSGMKVQSYSGLHDLDEDGAVDTLRLYVLPRDQKGRHYVVAGSLNVQVVELKPESLPRLITEATFDPAALDAGYRQGVLSERYVLDVDLPTDAIEGVNELSVKLTLTESGTGTVVTAEALFKL